jgi:Protein of unknown function (DUF4238)
MPGPRSEAIQHHTNPRHLLARFANDDGKLTVVREKPELMVLRGQAPENVGTRRRFNSFRGEDGQWRDDIERGPLANIDGAGDEALDAVIRFGIEADAEGHLRLYDGDLDARAKLQLFVATLLVRTAGFRESWDEGAAPTLASYMLARLEEKRAAGSVDRDDEEKEAYEVLKKALQTPGSIHLNAPAYHHQARLVPLIEKVGTRLHLDTLVAVRRFGEPLLFTGAEPVIMFPDARMDSGVACGEFFAGGEKPVEFWQEPDELWAQVEARMQGIAGIAVAVDPHTFVLMPNADTDDGEKLFLLASQVKPESLAALMNVCVAGASAWVAGRDDCELLRLLAESVERLRSQ